MAAGKSERVRLPVPVAPMLATLGSPPAVGTGYSVENEAGRKCAGSAIPAGCAA
jgi:hypothetical protein